MFSQGTCILYYQIMKMSTPFFANIKIILLYLRIVI